MSINSKEKFIICDNCKGYGGFDATKTSNGGLCPKCKGHGGFSSDDI